jgi:plasmid stabilization system protein ParE
MKYKVKYLPVADRDILRISDALLDYPNKAKRIFKEMEEKLVLLEDMPYMWPVYQVKPKYRRMVLEDHLLFYFVDEDEREVKVFRVLYDKMDIARQVTFQ